MIQLNQSPQLAFWLHVVYLQYTVHAVETYQIVCILLPFSGVHIRFFQSEIFREIQTNNKK